MADIQEVAQRICENPLSTVTDIRRAQNDLQLLEYLLTARAGWEPLEATRHRMIWHCVECREATTWYALYGTLYKLEHYPPGITFPLGMHGTDYEAYQCRSTLTTESPVPTVSPSLTIK